VDSGGRHEAGFLAYGLHADSRTPAPETGLRRAFTRAVVSRSDCRLLKKTTNDFSYKDDAHVEEWKSTLGRLIAAWGCNPLALEPE
jgi:hypothetical protein